jgi:selenoprotein W-related protein
LAALLDKEFGVSSELVASGGGVFEVTVDGQTVFSKRSLGRFPDEREVVEIIRTG